MGKNKKETIIVQNTAFLIIVINKYDMKSSENHISTLMTKLYEISKYVKVKSHESCKD